jgi:hypothetical protein
MERMLQVTGTHCVRSRAFMACLYGLAFPKLRRFLSGCELAEGTDRSLPLAAGGNGRDGSAVRADWEENTYSG